MNFLTSNVFIRDGRKFRSMRVSRSDLCVPAEVVTKSVREASRALDSSKKGGYQQSVESKVNDFAEHCCCWLGVVAVWG